MPPARARRRPLSPGASWNSEPRGRCTEVVPGVGTPGTGVPGVLY